MTDRADPQPSPQPAGAAQRAPSQPRERGRLARLLVAWPTAATLLAMHFALAVGASSTKSNTYDELAHITGGYTYWTLNDYRLNPEGDVLAQRLMALPLLLGDYKLPPHSDWASDPDSRDWRACDLWNFGYRFFYESGNDGRTMLLLSRSFMALLSVALGLLVFLWSRSLFGPTGGMLSLAMFALCPPILGNAGLATMDIAASLGFLAAIGAFWRLLHRLTLWRLTASLLALAALFLLKFSAVLAVPMLLVLLVARVIVPGPLEVGVGGKRLVANRPARAAILLATAALHALVVWLAIWAAYGARYEASPGVNVDRARNYAATRKWLVESDGPIRAQVHWLRQNRLLPEAYIYGFVITYDTTLGHNAFLNGRYSYDGWRSFFPYCLAVKTPLPMLAIGLLAILAAVAGSGMGVPPMCSTGVSPVSGKTNIWYHTLPLWVLIGIYMASSIGSHLNIGYRHVLPVWAAAIVLCGAGGKWFSSGSRVMGAVLIGLVLLLAAEVAWAWPNYLPYCNQIAGGTRNAYRHLVDSSTDWGQDLPALKKWLDANTAPGESVYLSYFGTANVESYGLKVSRLPAFRSIDLPYRPLVQYRPGLYCISASMLQGVLDPNAGPWIESWEKRYQFCQAEIRRQASQKGLTPYALLALAVRTDGWDRDLVEYDNLRYRRLTVYLRQRQPDHNVGGSILVYRLDQKQLDEAFNAPPAELIPDTQNPLWEPVAWASRP